MRALVIYTSQTGFTKKYAEWISARLDADLLTIQEAKKKKADFYNDYNAIIYGGWVMAGSVVNAKWYLQKSHEWKSKKLAIFCVGGFPENNPDTEACMKKLLTDELKAYVKAFYFQGGLDYSQMKATSRFAMKTLSSMMSKKKDATKEEKEMAEMISNNYDSTSEKYIEPLVNYIKGC